MIIAKIKQSGQVITLEDKLTTFRYSANLQMQFVKDDRYKDYVLIGWYRHLRKEEYLLDIDKDGIFTLGKDIFKQRGTVEFSFSLNNPANGEIIHLGVIEYVIEQSFGSGDAILPEEQDTWIQVVSRVVEDQVSDIWDKDYKPQLEQNLQIIEAKTEEIKTAAMEVKQDALESSVNAKSALDSANLAQSSANTALEAEEKALEHSTNAEKFKNDAFSYANQANLAKTEAQKSATDANSSASSALTNANKAKEHLDNVIEKVNAFNVDYTEKVNNFNSNVESANTALDAKIEKANTDIDKKVLDANTNLDKKIADANTSIDGKVTVATEQANIATSKATELSQAVDKVKHLEDVVDTKLTQPYVSSSIIENDTISDSDEGQLRNLKIYGKCTQKVETDIVPTPSRPVPITSKKIVVDGEVVELRSLKESVNLFDLASQSKVDLVPNNGYYRYINIPLRLKSNTQYTYSFDESIIPANVRLRLEIKTTENNALITTICDFQNQANDTQLIVPYRKNTFSLNNENKIVFSAYIEKTINGQNTPNNTEVFKENWYTKILNNIMLVEGTTVPSTYVAPTVRDYKIVDHVNKKSWIERNIAVEKNNNNKNFNDYTATNHRVIFSFNNRKPLAKVGAPNVICNIATPIPSAFDLKDILWETGNTYLYWYPNIYSLGLDGTETKTDANTKLNEFLAKTPMIVQYELAEPVIEEIPYIESDISEFGISSQDSTSPSPTIKSEVETIDKIEIKTCGKNMFDIEKAKDLNNWKASTQGGYSYFKIPVTKGAKYIFSYTSSLETGLVFYAGVALKVGGNISLWLYHSTQSALITNKLTFTATEDYIGLQISTNGITRGLDAMKNLQLEYGDTATDYEPYQETAFSYTLAKPLVRCGDIADVINIDKLNTDYFNKQIILNGKDNEAWGLGSGDGVILNETIRFVIVIRDCKPPIKGFTNNLKNFKGNNIYDDDVEGAYFETSYHDQYFRIRINKNRLETLDVDGFKKWLKDNPIELTYVLNNSITKPLEPELIEKLKKLKTFYPITHVFSNVPLEFAYKLNMPAWHKVVSGQVENAKDVIYNLTVKQNNLEVMQLQSALETQYNLDLLKLGGNLC